MTPSVPSAPMKISLQVVAGVVLAQAAQPVPHLAARKYDFEPQTKFARVAVAQDLYAAGVGD